jgi:AraC-like DNA-binding protein
MDLDALLQANNPAAIAWDLSAARPGDWRIVRWLRNHPCCGQTPFILYRQSDTEQPAPGQGLTSFVTRTAGFDSESQAEGSSGIASSQSLLEWINAARPPSTNGPILIVDDDEQARAHYVRLLEHTLPHYPFETAANGLQALALMADETPSLVILDLIMPQMDGFAVLEWIRTQPYLRGVPVLIVSSRMLTLGDVHRLEDHLLVSFQSKGLLTDQEMGAAFQKALLGSDSLPPQTSAMVKQALAYMHQNYTRSLARWEIAAAVGASEDYLGRVFRRELGLSPWDYLNRCRVHQAKELLLNTNSTIRAVAHQVGFKDAAYFSRVFHKLCGLSPADFRKSTN